MQVLDFLSGYPPINRDIDKLANAIFHLKEFYDNRLGPIDVPIIPGELLPQQKVVGRFLSSHTTYKGLLVVHETGTGKTCGAFAAAEANKHRKKIVFLTPNAPLYKAQKEELIKRCFPFEYRKKRGMLRPRLSGYTFKTHQEFASEVNRMSKEQQIQNYSDTVFIVDEVQKIRNLSVRDARKRAIKELKKRGISTDNEEYDKKLEIEQKKFGDKTYSHLHSLFHRVERSKVILLTATPMVDKASEIVDVLNLILPTDEQLPRRSLNSEKLVEAIQGRVSYMRSPLGAASRFIESFIGNFTEEERKRIITLVTPLKVVACRMKEEQSKFYLRALDMDLTGTSLGVVGGVERVRIGKGALLTETGKASLCVPLNEANSKKLIDRSIVFSTLLSKLRRDQGKSFVYISVVKGGLDELVKSLRTDGWMNVSRKPGISGKKCFVVITGGTTNRKQILERFNTPSNAEGAEIRFLIGSKAIGIGVTLKDVENVHILTPEWNYSGMEQILGRGVRAGSHQELELLRGKKIVVKNYLYVAIPEANDELSLTVNINGDEETCFNSLDLKKYITSIQKDKKILQVRRLLKENAIDCPLFYKRNAQESDENGSRECDYDICAYNCTGVDMKEVKNGILPNAVQSQNYNAFYDEKEVIRCIRYVRGAFSDRNIITFRDLLDECSRRIGPMSPFTLVKSLNRIILQRIPITNSDDFNMLLTHSGESFFLTKSITNAQNETTPRDTVINLKKDAEYMDRLSNALVLDLLKNECDSLVDVLNVEDDDVLLVALKLSIDIMMGIGGFDEEINREDSETRNAQRVVTHFRKFIGELEDNWIMIDLGNVQYCKNFNEPNSEWVTCSAKLLEKESFKMIEKAFRNKFDYILIENNEELFKDMLLVDLSSLYTLDSDDNKIPSLEAYLKTNVPSGEDTYFYNQIDFRKISTGRALSSITKKDKLNVLQKLQVSYDKKEDQDSIAEKIADELESREYKLRVRPENWNNIVIKVINCLKRNDNCCMKYEEECEADEECYWLDEETAKEEQRTNQCQKKK